MSTQVSIESIVRRHLRFLLPSEPLDIHASLEDLGLDSMSAINLLVDLEQSLELTFPDDMLNQELFATTHALMQGVEAHRASVGSS